MVRESFFNVKDIIRDRRKLTVFLVCVAVSLFSWMLISLGNNYSTTIIVPVKYANFPQNKTLLNSVPDYLAVNVSGSGYDILQYDDRLEKDTLTINLDNLKISVLGEYQRGYLDPALLSKSLQNRLNGMLAINRVLSDSIEFLFDLKVSRFVKVKPVVNYQVEQGFVLLDSIGVEPSEVEIYGPLSILDTMQFVKTMPIAAGSLNNSQTYQVRLDLMALGNNAQTVPDSVRVEVRVDKVTEKRFMLTPEELNVPDSLDLLLFPNAVEVMVQIPISRFNEVTIDDFKLNIDFSELQEGYQVLPVNLEKWPVMAQKVAVKPKQVEIVLSRRDS